MTIPHYQQIADAERHARMEQNFEHVNEPQMRRDALEERKPGRGAWIVIAACFVSVIVLAVAHAEPVRGVSNTVRMYQQLEQSQ